MVKFKVSPSRKSKYPLNRFLYWIQERENIRHNKGNGKVKPWTKDPILQEYKFCNVHREDDRVTRWITANWREPWQDHDDLWFAMCVARFINWPDTLDRIGFPNPWKPGRAISVIQEIKRDGHKAWTGAYVVSTNGVKMDKAEYIVNRVLSPLWIQRRSLRPELDEPLRCYADKLMACNGFSGFMTGQVIADLKYGHQLRGAVDWETWAISGPGSRRGLNRVLGRPISQPWKEDEWRKELHDLWLTTLDVLPIKMHCQDLQNCLCEMDKFERVLHGEGRPRSKYPGTK